MCILHADWSVRLGENRPDQSSQTFGGHACIIVFSMMLSSDFFQAYKVIDGACVCIVITALFGGSFIIAGIIFLVKSVKTPVHNILDGN